jgi:hypothetical protein
LSAFKKIAPKASRILKRILYFPAGYPRYLGAFVGFVGSVGGASVNIFSLREGLLLVLLVPCCGDKPKYILPVTQNFVVLFTKLNLMRTTVHTYKNNNDSKTTVYRTLPVNHLSSA